MKWLLKWREELNEDGRYEDREIWANSWEEVVGHFSAWMAKTSNVIKGKVICYWGENHMEMVNHVCISIFMQKKQMMMRNNPHYPISLRC